MYIFQMLLKAITRILGRMPALAEVFEIEAKRALGRSGGGASISHEVSSALGLLNKPLREEILFYDIGANKGEYVAEFLIRHPNTKVIAFEPSSSAFGELHNAFVGDSRVRLENLALGSQKGKASLYSNFPGSGLGSLTRRDLAFINIPFSYEEIIDVSTGADFLIETHEVPDFIKIDVEGHELDVLAGFGEGLSSISLIQFEFGGCNIDTRTFFKDFWVLLSGRFKIFRISPYGLIPITEYNEREESFLTSNYLAQRRV